MVFGLQHTVGDLCACAVFGVVFCRDVEKAAGFFRRSFFADVETCQLNERILE